MRGAVVTKKDSGTRRGDVGLPPQKRIFQQDILEAAAALVAGQGPQALSVRSLARAMGCSTQPIYSAFESMDALHTALIDYVREHYLRAQASSYKQVAVSFLNFARSQKKSVSAGLSAPASGRGDAVRGPQRAGDHSSVGNKSGAEPGKGCRSLPPYGLLLLLHGGHDGHR